jgi:hypothetical protein
MRPPWPYHTEETQHDDPADGNVGVVVDDLEAATAFFVELDLELEGEAVVEGRWADRVVGLDDVRVDVAMARTPDGHGRVAHYECWNRSCGATREFTPRRSAA